MTITESGVRSTIAQEKVTEKKIISDTVEREIPQPIFMGKNQSFNLIISDQSY